MLIFFEKKNTANIEIHMCDICAVCCVTVCLCAVLTVTTVYLMNTVFFFCFSASVKQKAKRIVFLPCNDNK